MEKFAEYGFNKSHSAAYALVAYQTAWLKAHYPAEFMAAVLSSDMDNTDKVVNFLGEARAMDLVVLPPDINASNYMFEASDDKTIVLRPGRGERRRPRCGRSHRRSATDAAARSATLPISAAASMRRRSTSACSKR